MELQISITDLCNYSCIMCMQQAHEGLYDAKDRIIPRLHNGNRGFIDKKVFKKILEDTKYIEFDLLKMQWNGESFIHPGITGLINILREYTNFKRIVFTTNVSVINQKIIEALKTLNINIQFVLSIDSFDQNIYKKIKGIDNIHKVEKNIDLLKKQLPKAIFTFQAIAMNENKHNIKEFIDYIKSKYLIDEIIWDEPLIYKKDSNHIFIKKLGAFNQLKYDEIHKNLFYDLIENKDYIITAWDGKGIRKPCVGPFTTPTFNWDGRMTYCCMDSELELSPGNIIDKSFEKLWNSKNSQQLRNAHLDKNADLYPRCKRCLNLNKI